uniref:Protein tyrosine phosphatase domain-containing protein 1 n=1 Tax=Dendroctonus ponderosae TaxID=77166 RepID=A0AAR5P150_DENPD
MSLTDLKNCSNGETVQANYNKLSDHVRRLTPHGIQCSVFCGGLNCKYENPENWKPDSLAIHGIYSHWVTDDILAMARPSTMVIIKKNIIQQFESLGIKSIINLQCPKEHSSCGQPLENSGFSYDPSVFMEQNIFYYNFTWKDYGDATFEGLLNMVKVIAFALTEGRVAIHCHAGLGRTGVLIACYLVFSLRVTANDAIRYVRLKRPGSVQTRGQILCVRHFAQFILPQTITFYLKENVSKDKYMNEFTLNRYLKRQRVVLHGYEERNFKYLPKIVHVLCERILKLCGCNDDDENQLNVSFTTDFLTEKLYGEIRRHESSYSISSIISLNPESIYLNPPGESSRGCSPNPSENGDSSDNFSEISTLDGDELSEDLLFENRCFQELETQKNFSQDHPQDDLIVQDTEDVLSALLTDFQTLNADTRQMVRQYMDEINSSKVGWLKLSVESNLNILVSLLFEWFEGLKTPILQVKNFEDIVILFKQPDECFRKFGMEEAYLIEYFLKFISKLVTGRQEYIDDVLKRFLATLSKHTVKINSAPIPSGKGFKRIGDGTLSCSVEFFKSMLDIVGNHHAQKMRSFSISEKMYENNSEEIIAFQ